MARPGAQRPPTRISPRCLRDKAGYEVVWKGKWHLSFAANAALGNGGEDWTAADIAVMETNYGWSGWNPPDGGNAIQDWQPTMFGKFDGLATLGGATPNNDGRYINGADPRPAGRPPGFGAERARFPEESGAPELGRPFCLFVSLVNPHDICVLSGHGWKDGGATDGEDFAGLGIELPPNYADDLVDQAQDSEGRARRLQQIRSTRDAASAAAITSISTRICTQLVDKHVMTVLDALEETGLTDKTIVLRLADHGEGGLSHGMREKAYTVYEEMIHIPLIVHNPKLLSRAGRDRGLLRPSRSPADAPRSGRRAESGFLCARREHRARDARSVGRACRTYVRFLFDDLFFAARRPSRLSHPRAFARETGPMRSISASTAAASNTSSTTSRATPCR